MSFMHLHDLGKNDIHVVLLIQAKNYVLPVYGTCVHQLLFIMMKNRNSEDPLIYWNSHDEYNLPSIYLQTDKLHDEDTGYWDVGGAPCPAQGGGKGNHKASDAFVHRILLFQAVQRFGDSDGAWKLKQEKKDFW